MRCIIAVVGMLATDLVGDLEQTVDVASIESCSVHWSGVPSLDPALGDVARMVNAQQHLNALSRYNACYDASIDL